MDELKKLVENLGVDNADEVIKSLQEQFDAKLEETKNEYELKKVKLVESLQEAADKKAQKELEEHKEKLKAWHEKVINEQIESVSEQLKIAKDIRSVRAGLEKMVEGMQEAGLDTTQVFQTVAANEVVSLEEQIEELKSSLAEQETYTKAFNRALIVEKATKELNELDRLNVINEASVLDETLEMARFESLVEMLVLDKKLQAKVQESNETEDESPKLEEKKSLGRINENFVGKSPSNPDVSDILAMLKGRNK